MRRTVLLPPSKSMQQRVGKVVSRLLCVSAVSAILGTAVPLSAQAVVGYYNVDIPRKTLDAALKDLAHQTGVQIAHFSDTIDGSTVVGPVSGELSLTQALEALLKSSGLTYRIINARTVVVLNPRDEANSSAAPKLRLFRLAQKDGGVVLMQGGSAASSSSAENEAVAEVIVTASKRAERIQDTASSVSALGGEEIERRGLVGMEDYLRGVPGVNNIDRGVAMNSIVIRGVTADGQNYTDMGGTVGLYLGDVPLAGYATYGSNVDIKLVDMERVEVLRGPQGTLYGDGSLGGTVRNIIRAPNLSRVEGYVRLGYGQTDKEGSDNSDVHAVLNLPLIDDQLAIRLVGYHYEQSGFVENIAASHDGFANNATQLGFDYLLLDQKDIGKARFTGGRVTALWRPNEKFQATLMLLRQDLSQDGLPEVQLSLGSFEQTRLQIDDRYGGGMERIRDNISIASLELEYDLGWGSLRSSTSYIDEQGYYLRDIGSFFGGIPYPQHVETDSTGFVEEVRFTSDFEGRFQFLAGAYYNDSVRDRFSESHRQDTPDTAVRQDGRDRDAISKQVALFGEASWQFTDQFKATIGARFFEYDQEFITLSYLTPTPTTSVLSSRNRTGETFKANLSWTPNTNALFYVQWAEGFRLGAPLSGPPQQTCDIDNDGLIDGTNIPSGERQLEPDNLESYELGTKLTLAGGRGLLSASVYRNDWTGIPVIVLVPCGFGQFMNAGEAQTQGVELESSWALSQRWRVNLSASYVDAELTKDAPGVGNKGDRLPASPRYNVNAGIQYTFDAAGIPAFVRADVLKVGGFYNTLAATGPEIGNYTTVNLRGGISIGNINIEAFANNATNADDLTWIDSVFANADARASRLRPRTIGLNVGYHF